MSIDLLFADFDRLIQSPESVHRLRRFILDLAVRGKLVPQDPNDEPTSELLKRIAAEKGRLVKAGKIRKPKKAQLIDYSSLFFGAPLGWAWARLSEISRKIHYGFTASAIQQIDDVRLLRITDIQHNKVEWDSVPGCEIDKEALPNFKLETGDILIARTGGTIGKSFLVVELPVAAVFASYLIRVQGSHEIYARYLKLFLESPIYWTQLREGARGAGQPNVNGQMLGTMLVSIPPLAEQHRIVAKVDELMALCDRLEAARAEREAKRDRLATASLARLNTPDSEPAIFQHDVAFALNNLTPLTTRPDQINALRQSILNLAVRGKLVPQDAKEDRSNQGKLRSDTTAETYDVRAFEGRMALLKRPDNWTIEPLSRVSSHIVDCLHTTPKWTEEGVLCIKTNQVRAGQLDLSSPHFVSENTHKTRVNRLEPRQDDILYIREGGVLGVACRVPSDTRLCLGQRLMQIRANNAIAPQFLELCLNSPWITEFAAEKTTGGAAPRVNMSIVRSYPIPLPPLGEQHRIVAKVDELKALCNRLEARLNRVGKTRGELVELLCARVA